jgi:hypothetical protein
MSYTVTIPIAVVNATHRGGYFELYLSYVRQGMKSREAYNAVEDDLERYGLPGRYSSYKNFRDAIWRMRPELKKWKKEHSIFV